MEGKITAVRGTLQCRGANVGRVRHAAGKAQHSTGNGAGRGEAPSRPDCGQLSRLAQLLGTPPTKTLHLSRCARHHVGPVKGRCASCTCGAVMGATDKQHGGMGGAPGAGLGLGVQLAPRPSSPPPASPTPPTTTASSPCPHLHPPAARSQRQRPVPSHILHVYSPQPHAAMPRSCSVLLCCRDTPRSARPVGCCPVQLPTADRGTASNSRAHKWSALSCGCLQALRTLQLVIP
jgi:hypothetical protein